MAAIYIYIALMFTPDEFSRSKTISLERAGKMMMEFRRFFARADVLTPFVGRFQDVCVEGKNSLKSPSSFDNV